MIRTRKPKRIPIAWPFPAPSIALAIHAAPATKKNGGTLIMRGGHRVRTNSDAFNRFEAVALVQLRNQWRMSGRSPMQIATPIASPVNLRALFYLAADWKSDVHGYYQALADVLVKAKVLADDNRRIVVAWDGSRVEVDRANPRIEVMIEPVDLVEQGAAH